MRCPPQGIYVCCPPRHVSAVTVRDAFSTTGDKQRVLVPPLGLCLWLNRPHKKPSKHQSFTFSCFCYRKKNCYPPPTSVTCVLPRERKVLSTAKRNRKQSVLCYLHVHVCNIFMMVLALLEEHHVFVERCCCATTWYVRRAHAQDKSPPSQY